MAGPWVSVRRRVPAAAYQSPPPPPSLPPKSPRRRRHPSCRRCRSRCRVRPGRWRHPGRARSLQRRHRGIAIAARGGVVTTAMQHALGQHAGGHAASRSQAHAHQAGAVARRCAWAVAARWAWRRHRRSQAWACRPVRRRDGASSARPGDEEHRAAKQHPERHTAAFMAGGSRCWRLGGDGAAAGAGSGAGAAAVVPPWARSSRRSNSVNLARSTVLRSGSFRRTRRACSAASVNLRWARQDLGQHVVGLGTAGLGLDDPRASSARRGSRPGWRRRAPVDRGQRKRQLRAERARQAGQRETWGGRSWDTSCGAARPHGREEQRYVRRGISRGHGADSGRRLMPDEFRCPLANHHGRRIGVAAHQRGHHRGVHHTQAFETVHAQRSPPRPCRPGPSCNCRPGGDGVGTGADQGFDFVVGLGLAVQSSRVQCALSAGACINLRVSL